MVSSMHGREPVPSTGLPRLRAYLLGPSHGSAAERARRFAPAFDALAAEGFEVVAPGRASQSTDDADHLLSVVDDDLDALLSADVIAVLPGAERLWEYAMAEALGLRLMPVNPAPRLLSA
ncbi:hypothetical protein [Micromonospora sp. WMMD1082]|uniref:hypothetical protein n=1 Tax=Micromonospora sp. WMMD1082 TaxID=3016104 RepID=UPI0024179ED1|nr:hypothetical protein [Micromonospora sp. WMMD1082]MDG4792729.1 hypothetical protein [Micromonospora sp. WMMD1082]